MGAGLSPQQRNVASRAVKRARRKGATPMERKALVEAGIVESQLEQLKGGDRDSTGFLQQRPSQGWGPVGESVERDTDQFLKAARQFRGKAKNAGQLAQMVQRSANPARYGQAGAQADAVLRSLGGSGPTPAAEGGTVSAQMSGDSHAADRVALTMDYLNDKADVLDLAGGLQQLQDTPGETLHFRLPGSGSSAPAAAVNGAHGGSPIAGEKAHGSDHDTAGLPGYPAHDYMARPGTRVVAPVSGKVIKLSGHDPKLGAVQGAGGPLGWSVYIEGDDGKTYYLTHMGSRSVKVGQRVKQGRGIGTVANYDKYGRPSHIHMGVKG
jgi:murein DD-endopeptidase MepM/ murein hydrolase activator NlpD